ncbi:MAG: ABC transporter permease [Polaromonas sp.]|jgi:osmoprotectant transport system permease protein
MAMKNQWLWVAALLAALVVFLPHSAPLFSSAFPQLERPVYTQEPFAWLLWQHMLLVGVSSLFSVVVGSAIGVWVTRPSGHAFRPLMESVLAMSQAFPPVAVLALAVPVVGFGDLPALLALALYGLLPVVQGTVSGLQGVPAAQRQAALSLGLTPRQCLRYIDLPLALPVWLSGVRTSVIINIGTAAIASTVGAKTLGSPIIIGLSGFNTAYVLQGAMLVALLAVTVDMAFEKLARRIARER